KVMWTTLRNTLSLHDALPIYRDARRVDLREARVGEQGAALGRAPRRRDVGVDRVGRQVIHGAVAARRENDRVGRVTLDFARDEVAADDAARAPLDEHEIEHLAPREQSD